MEREQGAEAGVAGSRGQKARRLSSEAGSVQVTGQEAAGSPRSGAGEDGGRRSFHTVGWFDDGALGKPARLPDVRVSDFLCPP